MADDRLRSLPSVDAVLDELADLDAPRPARVGAARQAVDEARERVRAGETVTRAEIVAAARELLGRRRKSLLTSVINATGVLIHTNLGRSPLGIEQTEAIAAIAARYSNLEYDLVAGGRGSRYSHASQLIGELTGAEASLVVNNNAAAVLLCLAALFENKEVIISRGELVEIGGEFRIPEVMALSKARLVEVGTTNRTRSADFERAITPDTAAILKVHPSNYRVVGFTEEVPARDLARLSRGRGVCLMYDVGSGLPRLEPESSVPAAGAWLRSEPDVAGALEDGCDIVTFSGDKLLGGPQAGVIAGRRELIEKVAKHPLLRALRVDKLTLAALEATLSLHLAGRRDEIPLWRMLTTEAAQLETRARRLMAALTSAVATVKCEAVRTTSTVGGGSAPGSELPSWGVHVDDPERTAAALERALRTAEPPVVARTDDDRLVLDLRSVAEEDDDRLLGALLQILT